MTTAMPGPGDGVVEPIVAAIRGVTDTTPTYGVVLGSGLGETTRVARDLTDATEGVELAYADLPGFPPTSATGHAGRLWIGEMAGTPVAIFQGRIHFYEGHGMPLASITSRVAAGLGSRAMVLTTAVGAVDPGLTGGTLVVVRDHLNLMGVNPLTGWRMSDGSPAFIGVGDVYDDDLSAAALASAREAGGTPVTEGVYAAAPGPSYETPAETEAMRRLGATVVGMSMVPEAVAARALGMRVLGLSFVTNAAGASVSHSEVLAASETAAGVIGRVLADLMKQR
jgi:purine-nucleoside phosphorylase